MMAMMREQMQRPATVSSIEIHGAKNTRRSFLDPLLKPVVDNSLNAGSTLGDVLASLQEVTDKLQRFGTLAIAGSNAFVRDSMADHELRRYL
jgi:outer membrane protein insertion porin family